MPSAPAPTAVPADIRQLFARISPIRHGSVLRYPGLIAHILWNRRRDRRWLRGEIEGMLEAHGQTLAPETLDAYLESVLLLNYLQKRDIAVYSMLRPELMESLALECARVLEAGVPGDLVDVGVWKGGSSMILKAVHDRLGADRRLLCLDVFDRMDEKVLDESDPIGDRLIVSSLELARRYFGTEGVATSVAEIRGNFERLGVSLEGVEFVEGNLISEDFPFERVGEIALLRIDCDFYSATRRTLEALYPKVQAGGVIILDDYYLDGFGERQAADELRAAVGAVTPLERVGQSAVWRVTR